MSKLSKLPRVSEVFLKHIKERTLEKNEWMPCPRCGEAKVDPPTGALIGSLTGAWLIGCWILFVVIVSVIFAVIFFPLAIIFAIIGFVMIPFLPAIGASMGMVYRCKSCGYNWTFKDIKDYKESRPC